MKDFRDIQEVRDYIDKIDYKILKLFSDRNRCVKEIVNFKNDRTEIIAKERQKELLALRRKWAEELNLDPALFENFYKRLIRSNIQKELRLFETNNNNLKTTKICRKDV